jgi:hypothetical protein
MLYEVVLTQNYFGQQCINRWNYSSSGTAGSQTAAFGLLNAMGWVPTAGVFPADTVASGLQGNQVTEVIYENVLVKALYDDPTDFIDYGFVSGVTGLVSVGDGMSPTAAVGFRTNRVRTDVARGTKRIVGITEAAVGNGGVIEESSLEAFDAVAALMSGVLTYSGGGASLTFTPAVCGKEEYPVPDTDRFAYRYYPTLSEQLAKTALGVTWSTYRTIRTQTSRQYGNGA